MANDKRHEDTVARASRAFAKSLAIMERNNKQRGDTWREVGAAGAYIELRNCVARLRELVWEAKAVPSDRSRWEDEIRNVCEDIRNFSVFCELCVEEENMDGDKYKDGL